MVGGVTTMAPSLNGQATRPDVRCMNPGCAVTDYVIHGEWVAFFPCGHNFPVASYGQLKAEAAAIRAAAPPSPPPLPAAPIHVPARHGDLSFNSFNSSGETADTWPAPLAKEAFHGLAGDVVRAVEDHSEADPAAVLFQTLAAFASAAGPSPHTMVGPTRHGVRLFVAIVGKTARARKGDSWQFPAALFRQADADWFAACVTTGLSTGEGLISAVRDATDADVSEPPDRRVLAVETELGRTLRVMAREGNTLSAVLRDCWDGRDLRVMTRGAPLRATGAHVGAIGHITATELKRELASNEASNGFSNRWLWCCAQRSKLLPDPEPVPPAVVGALAQRLRHALERARLTLGVQRDEETREAWTALYPLLTEERDGLAGDVLARSEAQVLRLSMLYALLDESRLIRREHLAAALACWDYCTASVMHLFGDASGDAVADDILRQLVTAGELTRTDISGRLGRNVKAERIRLALDALERSGQATRRKENTGGAPAELWKATGRPKRAAVPLLSRLTKQTNLTN